MFSDGTLYLGGSSGATLGGTEGNDTITGSTGGDTIWGHGGDDVLIPLAGTDYVHGDEGTDAIRLAVTNATASYRIPDAGNYTITAQSNGSVRIQGANAYTSGTGNNYAWDVESLQLTYSTLTSSYGIMVADWGGGTIVAASGSNVLVDGDGDDTISVSGGTAYWHKGAGDDTATLSGGTTNVYFDGGRTDYAIGWDGSSILTVTDSTASRNGTARVLTEPVPAAANDDRPMPARHAA